MSDLITKLLHSSILNSDILPETCPSIGVRFSRFNLSVGYELESFATFNSGNTSDYMDETINTGAIMFNFAVDWGARK